MTTRQHQHRRALPLGDHPLPTPHCYSWLPPEEFLRHALASYYSACRFVDAAYRVFPDDPYRPSQWLEELTNIITLRLQVAAHEAGIPHFASASEQLAGYLEIHPPTPEIPRENTHRRASHNENGR